ncbi:flagellar hook-associated protein FlgL [Desulfobacula phenolica]|uniref:Flagellin C-terminal helical region n=1 Tax=Desulfobacula phenolica TaxID=90732 RepID=A0A1H2DS67_9BACT|nr:flagellar hook-associated protein FlgL [Desulfobacula phenolica]SDT85730.1 flagellin C-terminal helical region [Desulfobacula phenolica]
MRVPNLSMYGNATYRLGGLTGNLQDANEVMATQKRINSISDDPVGLSQVLDLKSSIGNLEQIGKNVNMGISWLSSAENSLDSVNDLILDAKTQVSRLINASMSDDERRNAIGSINSMVDQIITLGNTQINGNYIFGGTETDTPPLELDKDASRVLYKGNNTPFGIKTDKNVTVPVGRDGKSTFWEDKVEINSTNNTLIFKEDNGHGSASQIILKATLDDGSYTTAQLETAVKNALNDLSSSDGYGVTYDVAYDGEQKTFSIREDGSYDGFVRTEFMWESGADAYLSKISGSSSIDPDDINVTVENPDALAISTPEPHGTQPIRLTWQGDNTWELENNPGYTIIPLTLSGKDDSIGIDLNESGFADIIITLDTPVTAKGQYIEFEIVSAQGDHSIGHEIGFNTDNSIYAPPTSDTNAVFVTDLTIPDGAVIKFEEFDSAGQSGVLTADINTTGLGVNYTDMDSLAAVIESAMEKESKDNGKGINYAVSYDALESKFNIREDGTSLNELQLLWSNTPEASETGDILGYYPFDDIITYPTSDHTAQLNITIDSTNNKIAFEETDGGGGKSGTLWATVADGTYTSMADFEAAVEKALEDASVVPLSDYTVSYNAADKFSIQGGGALAGLDLLWSKADSAQNSIGKTLGFNPSNDTGLGIGPYEGENDMVLMTFDATNNVIDFEEISIDGKVSDQISISIPEGEYTGLDDVAAKIQTALRDESPNNVKYVVTYDSAGEFMIKGSDADIKGFSLLWQTGDNRDASAADMLGFYGDDKIGFSESDEQIVNITIDSTNNNNKINFREILKGNDGKAVDELTAMIKEKVYTSHSELALEVEKALEEESYKNGNHIDYSVSWDSYTKNFTIKENGTELESFDLLWQTGENAPVSAGGSGGSIGEILGFDIEDDIAAPVESEREVEWGIFNTLVDLNQYLADNDPYGIERTLGRLEAHFESMTSKIVDVGNKYNRLEIRNKITTENNLSLKERKSTIEDADIVEAVMNLQAIEAAYQASLSSTAKIMNLSLVDYL